MSTKYFIQNIETTRDGYAKNIDRIYFDYLDRIKKKELYCFVDLSIKHLNNYVDFIRKVRDDTLERIEYMETYGITNPYTSFQTELNDNMNISTYFVNTIGLYYKGKDISDNDIPESLELITTIVDTYLKPSYEAIMKSIRITRSNSEAFNISILLTTLLRNYRERYTENISTDPSYSLYTKITNVLDTDYRTPLENGCRTRY